jgi:uncharacterized protein YeaO (DUF488 family)
MLKKASIADLKSGAITRDDSYIVITMCHYPRGIKKELADEYVKSLAPQDELLSDFIAEKKKCGNHNAAFAAVHYEQRFELSPEGIAELRRLADLSTRRDVTFVCQCAPDQRCHRELLLILARRWYGAATELRKFSYPLFERRVPEAEGELVHTAGAKQ